MQSFKRFCLKESSVSIEEILIKSKDFFDVIQKRVEGSERKTEHYILKSDDRKQSRENFIKYLISENMPFTIKSTSDSIDPIEIQLNGRNYRFRFKPMKGGGSGAGAKITALGESAQAIFSALFQEKNITFDEVKDMDKNEFLELFSTVNSFFDINLSVEEVAEFLVNNSDWLKSSIILGEAIKQNLGKGKKYIFHRGSSLVNALEKIVKRKLNEKGIKIDINKWSPADVWAIIPSFHISSWKNKTINDINLELLNQLNGSKDIVGLSLKKTSNTNPPIKYFNTREKKSNIKIDEILINVMINPKGKANYKMTKDTYLIDTDDGLKFQTRDFKNKIGGKVQGEIKGKEASGGKIGFGIIANWYKNKGITIQVFNKNDIIKGNNISEKFISGLMDMIQKANKNNKTKNFNVRDIEELRDIIKHMIADVGLDTTARTLSSKAQALQVAIYADADFLKFAKEYASSSIKDISAPFIKFGN